MVNWLSDYTLIFLWKLVSFTDYYFSFSAELRLAGYISEFGL